MAKLLFHGATREVTGSMHLVQVDGRWIALDCGLYQGHRAEADRKNREFPVDPAEIVAVVLSHAHTDHTGRLPLLVRSGFAGPIFATSATRDLCAVMLADSAHIQQEDTAYLNKKRARHGEAPIDPLYGPEDALAAVRQFHSVPYGRPFWAGRGVSARFFEAGHMLGSAGVELTISEEGRPPLTVVFTGDMGRRRTPILRDPAELPAADYLICESTYGGRRNPAVGDQTDRLGEIVTETVRGGGRVIIPAFSVGRTQTVVYSLHRLMHEGRMPRVPVFIDSPLAVDATEVFRLHPECYDSDAREFARETGDILGAACCTYIRRVEDSKALHRRRTPCVIISASGMCETGRILHHLKNHLQNAKNTILIVGFQAEHTLGRRLVEGEKRVRIFQQEYQVRARIEELHGFSGHADRDELLAATRPLAPRCRKAFLVHGEPEQMYAPRDGMRESGYATVETPARGDAVEL